jgi:calcineurin-like phosphoesterase family protein
MQVWFTSDTHFLHKNIIKYCDRPFSSIEEMDEQIISNWNKKISNDDIVYFLGDFIFTRDYEIFKKYSQKLNGKKICIYGNHDIFSIDDYINAGWISVYQLYDCIIDGIKIVMCHYPLMSWNNSINGSIMLHGHEHWKKQYIPDHNIYSKLQISEKRINVCQDSNNFYPYSIKDIINICKNRSINS